LNLFGGKKLMNEKTALLIIDVQVGIVEAESGHVFNSEALLTNINQIISDARLREIPILYVQDLDVAPQESKEFQIHPAIAPLESDRIIHKVATDAFHGTNLHEELQAIGANHLVIVGCKTEYCVDTTCRRATTLGYDVTLVADAHSTTDNKVLKAEQIINHHNANLHGLDNIDKFIIVRKVEDSVLEPIHNNYR
jgi:nicotinamidase-related amidase